MHTNLDDAPKRCTLDLVADNGWLGFSQNVAQHRSSAGFKAFCKARLLKHNPENTIATAARQQKAIASQRLYVTGKLYSFSEEKEWR